MGGQYALDKNHIYFADDSYWRIVNSAMHWRVEVDRVVARDSFEVLSGELARDCQRVYWCSDVLIGVAPATFEPLSTHYAISDGDVLYLYSGIHKSIVDDDGNYQGIAPIRLKDADAATLEPLAGLYGRDQATLFYHSVVVTRSAVATTTLLDSELAMTSGEVFFQGTLVPNADPTSLESLGDSRFYRDAHRVYVASYGGDDEWLAIVEGADAATFEVDESNEVARDKSSIHRVIYGDDHCYVATEPL